jgi:hypothetical protein
MAYVQNPLRFHRLLANGVLCGVPAFVVCLNLPAITGGVSGRILDPRGVPVAGAHLKLVTTAGVVIGEAESDPQGRFVLDGIEPGQYRLTADEPSFNSVISDVAVASGQQKQVSLQFRQLVSVSQAITVVASAPSSLTPDPAQSIVVHDQVPDANPAGRALRSQFRDFLSKLPREGLKHPNISLQVSPEITASPALSIFRSGTFSTLIICPPTSTATAMPIPIFSSRRRLLRSLWMAVRSTFAKGITRLILLPPTFQEADSTTSFRSQATIEMQMSWQGGALRIPRPMRGLASRRLLGMDSLIDWSTDSSTS